jgi:hypothetical protein
MYCALVDPTQKPEMFESAYKHPEEHVDWARAYQGYDAAVDWPSVAFFDTLYKLNPDAKVILTVRDPDQWFNSVIKTIHEWPAVDDTWPKQILNARKMARVVVRDGELGGDHILERREELKQQFLDHIQHVKSIVKPENLLVLNLGEGWENLCSFLGKPVPEGVPYPHSNKGNDFSSLLLNIKAQVDKGLCDI